MTNVKKFPAKEQTPDEKYQALLEENNKLYKRLNKLEAEREKHRERENVLRKMKDRMARKTKNMEDRAVVMDGVKTLPVYVNLNDPKLHEDIFGILKQVRWHLHAATTQFNLSVRKRRIVKAKSKQLTSYSNANPRFLTLMRICMFRYSTNQPLTTATIIADAEFHLIEASTVYRFLRESQQEGALIKKDHGIYEFSERLKQDYFHNLLQMIFAKETVHFVSLLRRVYGMIDLKMMAESSFTVARNHDMQHDIRQADTTAYQDLLALLSNFEFPEDI